MRSCYKMTLRLKFWNENCIQSFNNDLTIAYYIWYNIK